MRRFCRRFSRLDTGIVNIKFLRIKDVAAEFRHQYCGRILLKLGCYLLTWVLILQVRFFTNFERDRTFLFGQLNGATILLFHIASQICMALARQKETLLIIWVVGTMVFRVWVILEFIYSSKKQPFKGCISYKFFCLFLIMCLEQWTQCIGIMLRIFLIRKNKAMIASWRPKFKFIWRRIIVELPVTFGRCLS